MYNLHSLLGKYFGKSWFSCKLFWDNFLSLEFVANFANGRAESKLCKMSFQKIVWQIWHIVFPIFFGNCCFWQLFPLLQVVIIDNIFANCFMEVVRLSYFDADFAKWRSRQFFWPLVVYMVKSLNHQSIENSWYVMCTIYTDTKTYMLERSSILLTQNLKRKKNFQ